MNWFKHQSAAAEEYRLARMIRDLGWAGYGVYWVLMERLSRQQSMSVGMERVECYAYCGKRFVRQRMDRLLDDYGLFVTDERGMVRPASVSHESDIRPTSVPHESDISPTSDRHEDDNPRSNARAYRERKEKEKKREEEDVFDVEEVADDVLSDSEQPDGEVEAVCPTEPARAEEPLPESQQSEARRQLAEKFGTLPCYRHLEALCDRSSPWAEMVAMQSGYGARLLEHWEEAVLQFACHALSMGAVDRMATLQDVRSYFMNYARASGPTGCHLREHLEQLHIRLQEERRRNDPYRYEQCENGVRMVNGRPIPPDAPPRPSPQDYWNDWEGVWERVF